MRSAATKISKRDIKDDTPEKSLEALLCRKLLDCIYEICHKISIDRQLKKEYDEHESDYGTYWRGLMKDKKKLVEYKEDIVEADLRRKVTEHLVNANGKEAAMKDMMLIELAIKGDRIIFSQDQKSRKHIGGTVTMIPEIKGIIWQNPVKKGEDDFCEWLAGDEFNLEDRYLVEVDRVPDLRD